MRMRLRPAYSPEDLAKVYATPHQHRVFKDHRLRVAMTIGFASWFEGIRSVADLSAGDATIINAIDAPIKYIGDFAPGYELTGSIEKTIHEIPVVDLFICSETIEHMDDPDAMLALIRNKAKALILTTPIGEDNNGNPEHYWGWGTQDIREMLVNAGFTPVISTTLHFDDPSMIYDYQLWGCI